MFGGAAIAHAGAAFAQTPAKVHRVGLLGGGTPMSDKNPLWPALIRGLAQHGYSPGINIELEPRGAERKLDRLPRLLDELRAAQSEAVITIGYPSALAAKQQGASAFRRSAYGNPKISTRLSRPWTGRSRTPS
jgi:putative tryptophan/tyrosine transport system substrate-binding protein